KPTPSVPQVSRPAFEHGSLGFGGSSARDDGTASRTSANARTATTAVGRTASILAVVAVGGSAGPRAAGFEEVRYHHRARHRPVPASNIPPSTPVGGREVVMLELQSREIVEAPADAGSSLPVDLICTVCGYGAITRRSAVLCPMCGN